MKFPDRTIADDLIVELGDLMRRITMSASGYEASLLAKHGQEQDVNRAKRFGRFVVCLALISAIGYGYKAWAAFSGPIVLLLVPLSAFLAGATVMLVDAHFAAEGSPYDKRRIRAGRVAGRLIIVLLEALFAALPVCLYVMGPAIDVELQQLRADTVSDLSKRAAVAHDIAGRTALREKSKVEVEAAREALMVLPGAIVDAQQLAVSCRSDLEKLRSKNLAEADRLTNEFPALDRVIHSDADQATVQRAQARKEYIKRRSIILANEVNDKRMLCDNQKLAFEEGRKRYLDEATVAKDQAIARLNGAEASLTRANASYEAEASRSAEIVNKAIGRNNLAYEVGGMLRVLQSDRIWLMLAVAIYTGFFVLSSAPIVLRTLIKPGAYDAHRRTVLAREHMSAQTQYLADRAYHEAVRSELQSQKTLDEIRRRAAEDVACGHIGRGLGDWFANGGGRASRPAAAT